MRIRRLVLGVLVAVPLAPALLVTAARLLDPAGGLWVRLTSFTPHAVALYAVAFLLLVTAAATGVLRRAVSASLAVAVLPLLALHLLWVGGPYVGTPPVADGTGEPFTVMTANLLEGGAEPSSVLDAAVGTGADVVVLVEVTPQALRGLDREGLAGAFPHRAGKAEAGIGGTVVVSRHVLSQVAALDTTYRGFTMRVGLPGRDVDLVAAHPAPPLGDARKWRADHRKVLRAAIATGRPTVVAGDLNATRDHQPLRELAARGFESAVVAARSLWQPTWPADGELTVLGVGVPPLLQIDHVLVDERVRVSGARTVTVDGSDHRALVATLFVR